MDPYSAEGELINIHNHFHQGQYQEVVDFDTSSLSADNALPARVIQLRARIALGQAEDVIADVQGESEPALQAVGALAEQALGKSESAVKTIEKLVDSASEDAIVQVVGGTVLQAAGKSEEALSLLSKHSGNCTCIRLTVGHTRWWDMLANRSRFFLSYSGSRCAYRPNTPATKQNRSRDQRGCGSTEMGTGQPPG